MDVSDSPISGVTVARPFRIHTGFRTMSGLQYVTAPPAKLEKGQPARREDGFRDPAVRGGSRTH